MLFSVAHLGKIDGADYMLQLTSGDKVTVAVKAALLRSTSLLKNKFHWLMLRASKLINL